MLPSRNLAGSFGYRQLPELAAHEVVVTVIAGVR
jgi:hypothetical protein